MKLNIFSKILRSKPPSVGVDVSNDDETVITNFTESYLEAYFDGELETLEERQLEGVLGEKYVQNEMIKRGELRSIISRQSVLSVPSAHDLKQEKKRVWNDIEHELRLHLSKSPKKEIIPKFDLRDSILRSLAAGSACLVVGLVYLNFSSKDTMYGESLVANSPSIVGESNRDYVLVRPGEIEEMVRLVRDDSVKGNSRSLERESVGIRELKEFERHNALIANLNSGELSDLGASIIKNDDFNSGMITFVSNQRSYE